MSTAYDLTANGNSVSDFNALNDLPLSFGRTGGYGRSSGYIGGSTTVGHWWSSTAESSTEDSPAKGHRLNSSPSGVFTQDSGYRGGGFAIRCVAR